MSDGTRVQSGNLSAGNMRRVSDVFVGERVPADPAEFWRQ